jgi:hypothetical protein
MLKSSVRYTLVSAVAVALVGILAQISVITILGDPAKQAAMATAGWVGGFWVNLLTTIMTAITAGRHAAKTYEDPRMGRVAGSAAGLWSGLGAIIGQVLCGLHLTTVYQANIPAGQMLAFGLVFLGVSVVTSGITGRETAHPPEEEEA